MGTTPKTSLIARELWSTYLPEADLHTVIAHEFAHMRRKDFMKNLLYELLSLPVTYHPLLWLTRARIMESREMVCDQMAAAMTGRNEYAQSLLRLASLLVAGTLGRTPHTIGIFDANVFERRLMNLTEKHREIRGVRRVAIVAACAALASGNLRISTGAGNACKCGLSRQRQQRIQSTQTTYGLL